MVRGDGLFYRPTRHDYGSPEEFGLDYESVTFAASDGLRLHGWFFPATTGEPIGTVLHLHGNAGNVTGHFPFISWLPAAGWNVLCFDYRGYGRSEGRLTREGTILDGHAALDYLLTRDDVDDAGIVAFGQSLGGAVGIVLTARRTEIRGLATDGAFDHYQGIARWHVRRNPLLRAIAWWVPKLLMSNGHEPIDHVAKIAPRPVFIMHGAADRVVDPAMAQRLYDAAGEPRELWLLEDADHYEAIREFADEAQSRLLRFFEQCVETAGVCS